MRKKIWQQIKVTAIFPATLFESLSCTIRPERSALGVRPERSALGVRPERSALGVRPERSALGVRPERSALGVRPERSALGVHSRPTAFSKLNATGLLRQTCLSLDKLSDMTF